MDGKHSSTTVMDKHSALVPCLEVKTTLLSAHCAFLDERRDKHSELAFVCRLTGAATSFRSCWKPIGGENWWGSRNISSVTYYS